MLATMPFAVRWVALGTHLMWQAARHRPDTESGCDTTLTQPGSRHSPTQHFLLLVAHRFAKSIVITVALVHSGLQVGNEKCNYEQ